MLTRAKGELHPVYPFKYLKFNFFRIKFLTARNFSLTPQRLEDAPKNDINEDVNKKLMEFFDDKKNWNENEVKHGRSWALPELRIKSNQDLHKIWYVLLKERNMLKTMEHDYKRAWRFWASPERIDCVEESMKNLETVVRERNQAYHELETGHTGERPGKFQYNQIGMRQFRRLTEHPIPFHRNFKWREENPTRFGGMAVKKFLRLLKEQKFVERKKAHRRDANHVVRLLRRHPGISDEALREKYPDINLEWLRVRDKVRGHYVPKID